MKIELQGIGDLELVPVRVEKPEFPVVASNGEILTHKREGVVSFSWIDSANNKYEEKDVFRKIGNTLVPITKKISKTETIIKFEIVDKVDVYDLAEMKSYIVLLDATTEKNWEREIKDKAISFNIKLSSNGANWDKCFVSRWQDGFMGFVGFGSIQKARQEFNRIKSKKKETSEIRIKSEDIASEIEVLM